MRFAVLVSILTLCFVGCAHPHTAKRNKPIAKIGMEVNRHYLHGKWLEESKVVEGGSKTTMNDRSPDGTYVITFRVVLPNGRIVLSQEYGIWGLSGNIYFTKMLGWIENGERQPNPVGDSYYDDAYSVKTLTATDFIFETITDGEHGHQKKVSDSYDLLREQNKTLVPTATSIVPAAGAPTAHVAHL